MYKRHTPPKKKGAAHINIIGCASYYLINFTKQKLQREPYQDF